MAFFKSLCLLAAVFTLGLSLPADPAVAATTQSVVNTATLNLTHNGTAQSLSSNTVSLSFTRDRVPTVLKFYAMPDGFDYGTLTCQTTPVKGIHGALISPEQLDTMTEAGGVIGDTLGAVLWNTAANRDPNVRETVAIQAKASTGQSGTLILTETGPDTGVFAGGFSSTSPTSHAQACLPVMPTGTTYDITFGGDDSSLPSDDSILIDPYGHVFDSQTGQPVDGATITLINDDTGRPAQVFGDDGISAYPSTVVSGQDVTDASGHVYDYSTGDYRFPNIAPGRYHLQIVPPLAYVAPSLVAPQNLPKGPLGTYEANDASYGRSFDLESIVPLEADIPLDPVPHGVLTITKTTSLTEASPGDVIPYTLHVTNPEAGLMRGIRVTDTLPTGVKYRRSSTSGVAEPDISADGRTLVFQLPDMAAGAASDIRYSVEVLPNAPVGNAVNQAAVWIPGSPSSPTASATVRIDPFLMSDVLTIIGRVTEGDCDAKTGKGVANVRVLLDDGTYATTDRDGLYHFEGVRKGRHVVELDTQSLNPGYAPIACHDDTRWAGSATSRFVEGDGGSLHRVDFALKASGQPAAVAAEKLPITVIDGDIAAGGRTDWLLGQKPGIEWLFPGVDHNPRAPGVRVVIKHAPDQRVALTVNGQTTDPLAFDGVQKTDTVAVSVWTGLPLNEGDNVLQARVLDASGRVVQTLTRSVHYANTALVATYVPQLSRLIADGKTRPRIAVRLTDRDGRPVRDGAMVPFELDAPYIAAQVADMTQARQLAGLDRAGTTVRVSGDDGMAFIALQPTTQAGQAHVTFSLTADKTTRKSDIRAWLESGQRDWVVVGFAAGTAGFDTLSKNTHSYWLPKDRDLKTDGQVSFYAKGRIKGSWLLTMAYDSDRQFDPSTGLMSTIDPDKYYTVYGDGSRQASDAATSGKLYLRLERKDAYIMLGDFDTAMTETQLTRFNRTLNGVKAGFHNDRITATGFAARSDQTYARDEIRGNGLSGPYRLSAGSLIANTDKVAIETRDRLRPDRVLSSQPMTRYIDYDIDPDAGTLTFRNPVLSRDADLNPIYIVVDYEVAGTTDKRLVAGARVAAKVTDHLEIGVATLRDDTQDHGTVTGVDLKAQLNDTTELRAEVARGGKQSAGANDAYLLEVEHHGKHNDVLAYLRSQDDGFGLNQQNIADAGTRKAGIDATLRLTDAVTLTTSVWQQQSLIGAGSRSAADVKLDYRHDQGSLFVEATDASDNGLSPAAGTGEQTSQLLSVGGTHDFLDHKLQLNGQVQMALGGQKASLQFPVRQQLAVAYKISDTVRLIADHEIADGAGYTAHTSRIGFDVTPWHGAKLATTLNQLALGENGMRSFAEFGLSQSLDVGKRWTVDATLDANQTLKGSIDPDAVDPFQPIAAGTAINSDTANAGYTAITFGATYRAKTWSWNGRVEARKGERSDRTGLTSNLIRTLGEGKTVASSLRLYDVKDYMGRVARLGSADVSLAWRPLDSHWSVLERLTFVHERADAGVIGGDVLGIPLSSGETQLTTRLLNTTAVNYLSDLRQGHGVELSVYYGAKLIHGKLADDTFQGFIDTIGADVRKNLGAHFDIAFSVSQQTAHDTHVKSLAYGPSLGFSPKKDVWISVGYNVSGYHDPDADGSHYTQQGAYVTMRVKFDSATFRGMAR